MKNAINWFEIPVKDFDRAKKFYSTILDFEMPEETMGSYRMGFLPMSMNDGAVGGAIVLGDGYEPSEKGARVYLNGGEDLNEILMRVPEAGGKIQQPKTLITEEIGYCAFFVDSEGNQMALHSQH